jgi:hypothetical protein
VSAFTAAVPGPLVTGDVAAAWCWCSSRVAHCRIDETMCVLGCVITCATTPIAVYAHTHRVTPRHALPPRTTRRRGLFRRATQDLADLPRHSCAALQLAAHAEKGHIQQTVAAPLPCRPATLLRGWTLVRQRYQCCAEDGSLYSMCECPPQRRASSLFGLATRIVALRAAPARACHSGSV